jgi:hypothetical protein
MIMVNRTRTPRDFHHECATRCCSCLCGRQSEGIQAFDWRVGDLPQGVTLLCTAAETGQPPPLRRIRLGML